MGPDCQPVSEQVNYLGWSLPREVTIKRGEVNMAIDTTSVGTEESFQEQITRLKTESKRNTERPWSSSSKKEKP